MPFVLVGVKCMDINNINKAHWKYDVVKKNDVVFLHRLFCYCDCFKFTHLSVYTSKYAGVFLGAKRSLAVLNAVSDSFETVYQ